ncbi:MAG: endonuclease III [Melioribacteraceae bacterium]|nr:endonuclease III [Melioribacteraceae bacterium]
MKLNKRIQKINGLLIKYYGIPERNSRIPDPVDMLIGTILSQNTNDKNSFQAYKNLKKRFPSNEEIYKARRISIEKEIRIAGLGLQKSKAIKELVSGLMKKYGRISLDNIIHKANTEILDELTSFNGVGLKTASCVLLFALDRDICPVDTHVHRTLNRIGIVKQKTPDKTFNALHEDFPKGIAHSFHTNLIRLGREICKPSNPVCTKCPLFKICGFEPKNLKSSVLPTGSSFMLLDHI